MAKTTAAVTPATPAAAAPAEPRPSPRMGETVLVQIAPGALLRNNETGGFFAPDTPTPQTVTVTLLRRLQDRDLLLV